MRQQEDAATKLYDRIVARVHPKALLDGLGRVSPELMGIACALERHGYIPELPPLPPHPKISIVIPHYNHTKFLPEALEALIHQSELPDEIIVVDDQSYDADEAGRMCQERSGTVPIRFLRHTEKLYTGKAREFGARRAIGDIILMQDADDISHPDRTALTKLMFQKHPDAIHMNVGMAPFHGPFLDFLRRFDTAEAERRILGQDAIGARMRRLFITQAFTAARRFARARRGWYGANSTFGLQDGSIAFRKEVLDTVSYAQRGEHIFTKWPDYEFNFMLFLAGMRSYQLDLPLLYFRTDGSTFIS